MFSNKKRIPADTLNLFLFAVVWLSLVIFGYIPISQLKALCLRIAVRKVCLTERNTGLDTKSEYPVLGRVWKAAHIKILLWYMTRKAIQFGDAAGVFRL